MPPAPGRANVNVTGNGLYTCPTVLKRSEKGRSKVPPNENRWVRSRPLGPMSALGLLLSTAEFTKSASKADPTYLDRAYENCQLSALMPRNGFLTLARREVSKAL